MSILTLSGETQSGVIWSKNGIKKIKLIKKISFNDSN